MTNEIITPSPDQIVTPFDGRIKRILKNCDNNEGESPKNLESGPREVVIPAASAEIPIIDGELALHSLEQVYRVAKFLLQTGLVPSGYKNNQQAVALGILRAIQLKLSPLQVLENIYVQNGRIGMMGDLMLALVQPELKDLTKEYQGEGDDYGCKLTIQRKGRKANLYSFSIADAKRAGLWQKDNFQKYPDRMLYYRALGFALRDEFPDLLKGIKSIEELADYEH